MKKKTLLEKLFEGSTRDSSGEDESKGRQFVAEQLESRILYSAVPVDAGLPEASAQEAPAEIKALGPDGVGIRSIEEFGAESSISISTGPSEIVIGQMVTLLSFDGLYPEEVELINSAVLERSGDSGLSEAQTEEPRAMDISIADLEGPALGYAEGSHVFLDSEAAAIDWLVDSTPLDEVEFFIDEDGILDAIDESVATRMGLLDVMAHQMGQVLGLEDIPF